MAHIERSFHDGYFAGSPFVAQHCRTVKVNTQAETGKRDLNSS